MVQLDEDGCHGANLSRRLCPPCGHGQALDWKLVHALVGCEIPFPHTSIYFGEASKPIQLQTQGPEREQLKALVREVLEEAGQVGDRR